jgi:hypothetical protein
MYSSPVVNPSSHPKLTERPSVPSTSLLPSLPFSKNPTHITGRLTDSPTGSRSNMYSIRPPTTSHRRSSHLSEIDTSCTKCSQPSSSMVSVISTSSIKKITLPTPPSSIFNNLTSLPLSSSHTTRLVKPSLNPTNSAASLLF